MKKINLVICSILFLLIIVQFQTVKASYDYQDKAYLKGCLYSFNDPNFGAWSETTKTGVFMTLINKNKQIGPTEVARYDWYSNQTPRTFYDNFGGPGGQSPYNETSTIPTIYLQQGKESTVYTNCSIYIDIGQGGQIGGFYLDTFAYLYNGLHATADFNLSVGVIDKNDPNYLNSSKVENTYHSGYLEYNGKSSPAFYMSEIIGEDNPIQMVYFDNGNGIIGNTFQELSNTPLYSQKEITIVEKANLTLKDHPSGFLGFRAHNNYANGVALFPWFFRGIYVNSTTPLNNILSVPQINTSTIVFKTTLPNGSVEYNAQECSSSNSIGCRTYPPNTKINVTFDFKNPYNYNLVNISVCGALRGHLNYEMGRIWDPMPELWVNGPCINMGNFIPNEKKSFSYEITIPQGYYLYPSLYYSFIVKSNYINREYFTTIGGDGDDYLAFGTSEATIQYSTLNNGLSFKVNISMHATSKYVNSSIVSGVIKPNDYQLNMSVYKFETNGSKSIVKKFAIPLDQSAFDDLGINQINSQSVEYVFEIPININEYPAGEDYRFDIEAIPSSPAHRLYNYVTTNLVYMFHFKSGGILSADNQNNEFKLTSNKKTDTKKIIIANPSFARRTFNLSVIQLSDKSNFSVSGIPQLGVLTIDGLSVLELDLNVRGLFNPWPKWPINLGKNNFTLKIEDITPLSNMVDSHLDSETTKYDISVASEKIDGGALCPGLNSFNKCLHNETYTCDWITSAISPPGNTNSGECLSCTEDNKIYECGTYNNNESCNAHNCDFDDVYPGSKVDGCGWDYNENGCFPTISGCLYNVTYGTCESDGFLTIKHIPIDNCAPIADIRLHCSDVIILPFFSLFNIITCILAIATIYCIYLRKN